MGKESLHIQTLIWLTHLILGLFDLNFESVFKKLFLHLYSALSKLSGLIWKDTNWFDNLNSLYD